jgi:hypothetical protein
MESSQKRVPPSWLWNVTEEKRREMLAKRDSSGQPVWELQRLTKEQVLQRPRPNADHAETAMLILMAELREDPITDACSECGRAMSPTRAPQTCEGCYTRSQRRAS